MSVVRAMNFIGTLAGRLPIVRPIGYRSVQVNGQHSEAHVIGLELQQCVHCGVPRASLLINRFWYSGCSDITTRARNADLVSNIARESLSRGMQGLTVFAFGDGDAQFYQNLGFHVVLSRSDVHLMVLQLATISDTRYGL